MPKQVQLDRAGVTCSGFSQTSGSIPIDARRLGCRVNLQRFWADMILLATPAKPCPERKIMFSETSLSRVITPTSIAWPSSVKIDIKIQVKR